jgi:signal recognition particle subunit SEC65
MLNKPLPIELKRLQPILNELGLEWSDHFTPRLNPENCWAVINKETRRAKRVAMSVNEAREEAIRLTAFKLREQNDKLKAIRRAVEDIAKDI